MSHPEASPLAPAPPPAPVADPAHPLRIERLASGVAILTFDTPGKPVNTLRAGTSAALERALEQLERDPGVSAVVFASGKPDSFVVGADLEMLREVTTATEAEALSRVGQRGFARLAAMGKPVVAEVHGPCLGGGFELALACRAIVASSDPRTVFGLPEVMLGLLPGADGLQRVCARIGLAGALDLGLTGKSLKARRAARLGLLDDVVPRAILRQAAIERASSLARGAKAGPPRTLRSRLEALALENNPVGRALVFRKARAEASARTHGHYPAVDRILDVLESYLSAGLEASRQVEARAFGELVMSETAARLIEIFFAQNELKKDPGTGVLGVEPHPVRKIAVIGAGLMGAGIGQVSASAGVEVRLKDRDTGAVARGLKTIADGFRERARRGGLTPLEERQRMSLVSGTTDYSGLGNAEVIIEAVFEDLELKRRILREVEAVSGPSAIFASNTSSIPIARVAEAAARPEQVVGMHYFSPVPKMPLLEVIRTEKTAPWVVATAVALGKKQGKTVIVVKDGVGFYTSRILGPYMNEAAYLLTEGAPIDEIDRALVRWGWPVGPMALLDEVGIDVAAHVGPIMREAFGERLAPPEAVSRMVSDGRKGRKNERGLYLYGDAARASSRGILGLGKGKRGARAPDPSVYALLGVAPRPGKVPPEEIQMRCSLQFINEALHCHGEGILRSARDGDIGAIFGLGFPPFRGGPFRYVDTVGAVEILRRVRAYEDRFGLRFTPAPALVEAAASGRRFYGPLQAD